MIEKHFDIPFVADLAIREKQSQQNYRPIIAVHKWFARRPGTLFRALLLSEFVEEPLRAAFYASHDLSGRKVADPFMGGGTPLIEANRVGCDVVGYDINPMSYWIVRQEVEHLDLASYRAAANALRADLAKVVGSLYRTRCVKCGNAEAHAKYFLWVKTKKCENCGKNIDLFPGYLIAEDVRHPRNVLVCGGCGELNERADRKVPGVCDHCKAHLSLKGPATRNQCKCPYCAAVNKYPLPAKGAPSHRMFCIEYHCPRCKGTHKGRFFKKPDATDLAKYAEAETLMETVKSRHIPDDEIPSGDETDRLHRWGYRRYREMFNARQLLGLEHSCRLIAKNQEDRLRHALSTNLSDLLRYQNMLCRYDTMALKSLDVFSVHGFPVGLVACESNLLGISSATAGSSIGSGGWSNIIDKFEKAKAYCDAPFEVRHENGKKIKVPIHGEWIGEERDAVLLRGGERRRVAIKCADASRADIAPGTLDAVFTDPPYYGSVQYAELMDFCYVWLRRLVPPTDEAFKAVTTRNIRELTENENMGRGLEAFAEGLSAVFQRMAISLKPGAPLAFTYHHNKIEAYIPVAVAILDAGLLVSAAIPCPAEMEGSIHINGTGSSIIDTVFVCRAERNASSQPVQPDPEGVARAVQSDVTALRRARVEASHGDTRCITHGHMIRVAVAQLRQAWRALDKTSRKIEKVEQALAVLGIESIYMHLVAGVPAREETKETDPSAACLTTSTKPDGIGMKTKGKKNGGSVPI